MPLLDQTVATVIADHIATMPSDTILAFDTTVAFIPVVTMLTSMSVSGVNNIFVISVYSREYNTLPVLLNII
jgi:hypothetical protein